MRKFLRFFLKRFFDIFNSLIAIIFFLIPWIIVSIRIKIQSKGPIIYKARRIGKNGKIFLCYKFRTMRIDEQHIGATTLANDSRIFPFGRFLRKTKLDETPQLINILKGEMSIIGPRPEDEINYSLMYDGIFKSILSVKPGLSSPASIFDYTHGSQYKDEIEYVDLFLPKKKLLELYYVNHMNLFYDLTLIFRTVFVIIAISLGRKKFKEPKELRKIQSEKE